MSERFSGSPLVEGTWETIDSGHKLIYLGEDHVLGWEPDSGHYRIWRYDRSVTEGNPFSEPPLVEGIWDTIITGHELIYLGYNLVLDLEPATGCYHIWRYDRTIGEGDPFPGPPVMQGTWLSQSTERQLINLGKHSVLDWAPTTGHYQIWQADQMSDKYASSIEPPPTKVSLFTAVKPEDASTASPENSHVDPKDAPTPPSIKTSNLFPGLNLDKKSTPPSAPKNSPTDTQPIVTSSDTQPDLASDTQPILTGSLLSDKALSKQKSPSETKETKDAKKKPDAFSIMGGTLQKAIQDRVTHSMATFYVDALYQGTEKGTQVQPYRTITNALNRAIADNKVIVAPGIYRENIQLKENVKLISQITGMAVIHGNATRFGGKPTVLGANNATLTGFTIMGGYTGILCKETSPIIKHNIIRSNYGDYGLACLAHSHATIHNNIILANFGSETNGLAIGLYIENASPTLYNNIITDNNIGYVSYQSNPLERYNNIWKNRRNYGRATKVNRRTISVDPKFMDPSRGDFRLRPDSRCLGAGRDIDETTGTPRNIGVFDGKSEDVVEIDWDNLPGTAKSTLQSFPYIKHIWRWTDKRWENALDKQLQHYWAMSGDTILLQGINLTASHHANQWLSTLSGDMGIPIVHFGNIKQKANSKNADIPKFKQSDASLQQLSVQAPTNVGSGWVFIKRQGLESNPIYLEIRRP